MSSKKNVMGRTREWGFRFDCLTNFTVINVNKAEIHLYICKSSKTPWQEKLEIENEHFITDPLGFNHAPVFIFLIPPRWVLRLGVVD